MQRSCSQNGLSRRRSIPQNKRTEPSRDHALFGQSIHSCVVSLRQRTLQVTVARGNHPKCSHDLRSHANNKNNKKNPKHLVLFIYSGYASQMQTARIGLNERFKRNDHVGLRFMFAIYTLGQYSMMDSVGTAYTYCRK